MISVSSEVKNEFLKDFQNRILKGRRLLQNANHRWADKLYTNLYFEIEKHDWIDTQKKHQLIQVIINSWWIYLNSLIKREESKIVHMEYVKLVDAYNRFFSFLVKLDDIQQFSSFFISLLRKFLELDRLSISGITEYINSFSKILSDKGLHIQLIEFQILLMYLRKSVIPSDYYNLSMQVLGKTLYDLEPNNRALFLSVFLQNVNQKYKLMDNSDEFVNTMNKILVNRIPNYLKGEFSKLSRVAVNERNFNSIFEDLQNLIYYMSNLVLDRWIIIIVRYLFSKISEFQSFENALNYVKNFIEFSISRNKFEMTYLTFEFIEDVLMYRSDLGYDRELIEWWMEACNRFVDKDEGYLQKSLERLNNHLKLPYRSSDIFHFFYSCNYLWKIKSRFFSVEEYDFWRMMFYRALFEEKDFTLAKKIIFYLDDDLKSQLTGLKSIYDGAKLSDMKKYVFDDEDEDVFQVIGTKFVVKQMIIRINSNGQIAYRIRTANEEIIERRIVSEFWNENHLIDVYKDFFNLKNDQREYDFTITEYGKLLYIFLPKLLREFIEHLKAGNLNFKPQVILVVNKMTVPFEFIYENKFFMLNSAISYRIGEEPISGINFFKNDHFESETNLTHKFNVLVIESINARSPIKWNEQKMKKELLFPFQNGEDQLRFIVNYFNTQAQVVQIDVLSGRNSTKEKIMFSLSKGIYQIIHIIGNIFYSPSDPKNSLLLTNDNNKISFTEIRRQLLKTTNGVHPLICCDTQIYDSQGALIKNSINRFSKITSQFDFNTVYGIIARNYPVINQETQDLLAEFYKNIFNKSSIGVALLKARQSIMARKASEIAELKWSIDEEMMKIALTLSSYTLFGNPWYII